VNVNATLINERYQLQTPIGKGGMGVVFRALDRLSGQAVALKRVYDPGADTSLASTNRSIDKRLALAQEFQLLASLRHPHIISVLDYGFDAQRQPYFTMDLLENPVTVTEYCLDLPADKKLQALLDILQALKYLHRREILHRDLKPANILVAGDQLKVLDFGLAIVHEQHQSDKTSTSGTLAYMAPELLTGNSASESSDLYAVGVVAYELFSGRHPFHFDTMPVMLDAILKATPNLSEIKAPEGVNRVIERLLAKQPQDRYQSADEVLFALSEATGHALALETEATRESFLQASRLVGRERELNQLTDLLDAARDGKGSLWLIAGESGVGKSRLVGELRAQALVRGALAMLGQEVSEGGSSYQLWRDVLRWLSLFTMVDDSEAAVLNTIVPDLDRLLGHAISAVPDLPPQAAQQRLLNVIAALFQRQKQPLVLILEDVHWSWESLDILKALSEPIKKLPVLILATFRDDERPDLPRMVPGANVLKLERLSHEAIAQLSESMIGEAGRSPEVVDLLERETEGNVFFAVEVVRALAEEAGQLDRVGSSALPRHVSAGGVSQIVQRRLSHIRPENRPLLQLAAVLGRNIDLRLLEAAEPAWDLQRWLVDCADAAVLAVGEERWRFSHDKLRDGLREELTAKERSTLYRRAAELVESVYPDLPDQATRLAFYWNRAGDAEKERYYTTIAARQAHHSGAILEAIRLYRRAIELLMALPETPQRNAEELALQLDLGANVLPAKGYGSAETFETYERSRILCQKIGATP